MAENTFDDFGDKIGATVVLEGFPVFAVTSKDEIYRIISAKIPISEKVKRFAVILDYESTVVSGGYLLRKRYHKAQDLPCVSAPEIDGIIARIRSLCEQYSLGTRVINGVGPRVRAIKTIYDELSVPQRNQLQAEGVWFQSLSPSQKEQVARLLLDTFFGPVLSACFQASIIAAELQSSVVKVQGNRAICLLKRQGRTVTRELFPRTDLPGGFRLVEEAPTWSRAYRTAPTLAEYAKTCSRKVFVDPILAEKPLLVLGKEADSDRVLAMVAQLYSCRLQTKGDVRQLTPKEPPHSLDFSRVLASMLPETLGRYLLTQARSSVFPPAFAPVVERDVVQELGKETVPFATLSAFQKRCALLNVLNAVVSALFQREGAVPTYVSQMSQLLIRGNVYTELGKSWLLLTFAVPEGPSGAPRVRLTLARIPL